MKREDRGEEKRKCLTSEKEKRREQDMRRMRGKHVTNGGKVRIEEEGKACDKGGGRRKDVINGE